MEADKVKYSILHCKSMKTIHLSLQYYFRVSSLFTIKLDILAIVLPITVIVLTYYVQKYLANRKDPCDN